MKAENFFVTYNSHTLVLIKLLVSTITCVLASHNNFKNGDTSTDNVTSFVQDFGGWTTDESSRIVNAGPCNIDIADSSLMQAQFLERYAYSRPVVVKRVASNKVFHELTTRGRLLEAYGSKEIIVSTANTYSYKKTKIRLDDYIEKVLQPQRRGTLGNETLYWFGDNNVTEWSGLFDEYKPPPYSLPRHTSAYSFGVAGPGTGVPFHFHGPGFSEVIYGKKRWFLYPPESKVTFNPDHSTLTWFLDHYSSAVRETDLWECTIGPDEAIYFPAHWLHGTLNVDTSVFISTFLS